MTDQGLASLNRSDEDPPQSGTDVERRDRRRAKRAFLVMLALFLVLLAGVAGFFGYLGLTVSSNVTQADLLPDARPPITAPDGTEIAETGTGTNFLVIGTDSWSGEAARADAIVLVHVPADSSTVNMIHFPRDLYIDIPGHGKNKINAAYALGREPLLVQTMENLLKIRIHHVAKTDITGFKNMTDAVGGVTVYAEEASDGTGNGGPVVITQGWNTLNGEQALGFVRERFVLSEGDISRGRRQLALIKALMVQVTSTSTLTNPVKIAGITDAATQNLVVDQNFSVADLRDYAIGLRGVRGSDVRFSTAPFAGFGTSPDGASIELVDAQGMAELGEALRTDAMDTYADVFTTP